jgi:dihydroflavonol-4-reductase
MRVRALVTGASGFIGGAVARALLAKNVDVRVLARAGTRANVPRPNDVEHVRGDVRDAASLRSAIDGCDVVFHVAALYSLHAAATELHATNVDGTRNVIEAVRANGPRLVYTSSISTIGGMRGGVLPDEDQQPKGRAPGPYKASKARAEACVRTAIARGLDAVIVNPTFPIGWGDVKPTPTGAVIRDALRGSLPGYIATGMNVVDVDDVAQGHWLAFERGRRGSRYILGNANLTMRELLALVAEVAGCTPPRIRVPYLVALGLARADEVLARVLRRAPRVPLEGVRTARELRFASSARAVRELGLPQPPIRHALEKAVRWFRQPNERQHG